MGGLLSVVAELAGVIVSNPLLYRVLESVPARVPICVASRPGEAHHVTNPAELRVLRLQEIVVHELRLVVVDDARSRQVVLYAQALRQRPVVEVLAVPSLAFRHRLRAGRQGEKQQERNHVDFLRAQV